MVIENDTIQSGIHVKVP